MLRLIGLGIHGFRGISVDALIAIQDSQHIFFDTYTSITDEMSVIALKEKFSSVVFADRDMLENSSRIIELSENENVSVIVVGDPLSATTHNQLRLEAVRKGIKVEIFPASTIVTYAPSIAGLYLYRMGPPVSLPFTDSKFFPASVYRKIRKNLDSDLHTLLLLDLKEGKTMPLPTACDTLKEMEAREKGDILGKTEIIAVCSAGMDGESVFIGKIDDFATLGDRSPCCLIIPSSLSDTEKEFVEAFTTRIIGT